MKNAHRTESYVQIPIKRVGIAYELRGSTSAISQPFKNVTKYHGNPPATKLLQLV